MITNLFFWDRNEEWLNLISDSLSKNNSVWTSSSIKNLEDIISTPKDQIKVVFIGKGFFQDNLEILNALIDTGYPNCYFILMISGRVTPEETRKYFSMKFFDVIEKPYELKSIEAVLESELAYLRKRKKRTNQKKVQEDSNSQKNQLLKLVKSSIN